MCYDSHKFFCMYCGGESLPLLRKHSKQKERFHRKKLYCYHCQNTVNHIECRDSNDVEIFKEEFKQGVYENEAKESLIHIQSEKIFG